MTTIGTCAGLEVAHRDAAGRLHGHSLVVEAYRPAGPDLDAWQAELRGVLAPLGAVPLESGPVGSGRFEALADYVMSELPAATRVVVRLPSAGHQVEVISPDPQTPENNLHSPQIGA